MAAGATPEGWYPDVERPGGERYWDGSLWTEQRRNAGDTSGGFSSPPPDSTPHDIGSARLRAATAGLRPATAELRPTAARLRSATAELRRASRRRLRAAESATGVRLACRVHPVRRCRSGLPQVHSARLGARSVDRRARAVHLLHRLRAVDSGHDHGLDIDESHRSWREGSEPTRDGQGSVHRRSGRSRGRTGVDRARGAHRHDQHLTGGA